MSQSLVLQLRVCSLINGNSAVFRTGKQHIKQDCGDVLKISIPPSSLSLPVLTPPDRDRPAWLSLSTGVDRVLRVPCQLWLVGRTRGGEALTGSDRSRGRPVPVHHLSAHAQWVLHSPFNAMCNTGQLPAARVCAGFCDNICYFHLISTHG